MFDNFFLSQMKLKTNARVRIQHMVFSDLSTDHPFCLESVEITRKYNSRGFEKARTEKTRARKNTRGKNKRLKIRLRF